MTKRRLPQPEHADTLSLKALRELVTGLVARADRAEIRIEALAADNRKLREENDQLRIENTRLKVDNQLLRDEITRLKNLPPRPPFRPSGMEQATSDSKRCFRPTFRIGVRLLMLCPNRASTYDDYRVYA